MATLTYIVDDLDGATPAVTHQISIDGLTYNIDLSEKSMTALLDDLQPYLAKARKVSNVRKHRPSGGVRRQRTAALKQVRAWANNNGYSVSKYGIVPAEAMNKYNAVHGTNL